jgi:ABC-type branched-subunit amino acid transport system substrate-binding protein
MTARIGIGVAVGLLLLAAQIPALGQEMQRTGRDSIPAISATETIFEEGVRAYEQGRYELALRRFESILEQYRFNRRTTSALLMAGHAHFQLQQYDRARDYYTRLIEEYPDSRYVSEARDSRDTIDQQETRGDDRPDVIDLGITLPMDREEDRSYTRALFNGIRLAVDEYNARHEESKLRMIFRQSGQQPDSARRAVQTLIREDSVDVIIGPLYSTSEVIPAAGVAEDLQVPLVAPMATEEGVTMNREFVFQINPPLNVRGRRLAEYAVVERDYSRIGIVTRLGTDGERMARSFRNELERRNGEVGLFELLSSGSDWYRLPERIEPADTLQTLDALFLPITGDRASAYTDAAVGSLTRMRQSVSLLGNSAWRSMRSRDGIRQFDLIYEDSFWPGDTGEDDAFAQRYNRLGGGDPNHLSYVGYDVTRFLTGHVSVRGSGPSIAESLRSAGPYEGEGIRIDFDGGQINQGLFFLTVRDGRPVVLE